VSDGHGESRKAHLTPEDGDVQFYREYLFDE